MAVTAPHVVTIIADDLTGACDTGCLFAGPGPVGFVAEPDLRTSDRDVIALDTETRALGRQASAASVRAAVERLRERLRTGHVLKKIDSTMRGTVGLELRTLLEHGPPFSSVLVCPAFPAHRRVVRHGRLLVDSVPVHHSAFGRDPAFPAPTSEVAGLLGDVGPIDHLGLDDVRAGQEKIRHVLEQHRGVVVADAETDADLAALAEAALAVPGTLVAGSAGLGRALSRALGCAGPTVPLPPGRARLVVFGSLHPASRAQLDEVAGYGPIVRADAYHHGDLDPAIDALARERPAAVASTTAPGSREAVAHHLAQAAAGILARVAVDLVAVTGGDTAYALIRALRPRRFDLLGAPADGLALGRLGLAAGRELALLTKAGGFGSANLFDSIVGGTS